MGFSHATWDNRHWLIGVHVLFIIGYGLTLVLGVFIWHSFHLSSLELVKLAGSYWYIFFLPLFLMIAAAWLVSSATPDELTRSTPAVELGRKDLQNRLESFCIAAGMPLINLFLVEHTAFNALYWEKESDRRLYLTKGAIDGLSPEELDCVIAQGVGRAANGDFRIYPFMSFFITYGSQLTLAALAVACYGAVRALPLIFLLDNLFGLSVYAVLISLSLLWLAFRWYGQYFGWSREFAADLYSIKLTKNAMALANAIDKSKDHYYFPIVTEELRAMMFINPDPGMTLPWYEDPDRRLEHLKLELGAGAFTTS